MASLALARSYIAFSLIAVFAATLLAACSGDGGRLVPAATPTTTPASSPTFSPTTTPANTATTSPSPTPSATATSSPTPSLTPTATFVPGSCDDPAVQASEPLCALDHANVHCDFLVPEVCLLPYPSAAFLTPDPSTPTGVRIDYPRAAMPANGLDIHIDPAEWNTLDGFSPGPIIEALFPRGVDLSASGVPPITELARSLDADSPTVLLDADSGERIPHFVELDVRASGPATQMFLIRPAVRLREATRYIVAIRALVDPGGNPIAPRRAFRILRDGLETPVRAVAARRAHFEDIFSTLGSAGIARDNLILAWDFVTASTQSLTGRALAMRDQGLAANGPGAPPFTITAVDDDYSNHIFRRVRGTFTAPLFMRSATPPARYNLDEEGVPRQKGWTEVPFTVTIPRSAVAGGNAHPGRPVVYGHGLLGSRREVQAGHLQEFSDRVDLVLAATDWIGMAEEDRDVTTEMVTELSAFPALPDRLQQAMLNFMLLARLLIAPDGLASDPTFQIDGTPLIDTQQVYFYGISQGGIQGATYLALSTDTTRGVLGVGAANYSILLQRSRDFAPFEFVLNQSYPNELERQLLFPLLQQLWDRGEPQGYLSHLVADPLPGTPAKQILMQIGVNDSQVPNIGTEIEARSLGIPTVSPSAWPRFGIAEKPAPFDGSAFVPYDVNGTAPPLTNSPPLLDNGVHEAVRRLPEAQAQIDAFLRPDGRVENFCPGACSFRDVPNVTQR